MQRTCDEPAEAPPCTSHNTCDAGVNTSVMVEIDSPTGMTATKGPLLWQRRFYAMLVQLVEKHGGEGKKVISKVGRILGLSQSYASQLFHGERNIGIVKFTEAMGRYPMQIRYFNDKNLDGGDPDHTNYRAPKTDADALAAMLGAAGTGATGTAVISAPQLDAFQPYRLVVELDATREEIDELGRLEIEDVQSPGQIRTALKTIRQMREAGASKAKRLEAARASATTAGALERGKKLGGHPREKARPRPKRAPRKKKAGDDS